MFPEFFCFFSAIVTVGAEMNSCWNVSVRGTEERRAPERSSTGAARCFLRDCSFLGFRLIGGRSSENTGHVLCVLNSVCSHLKPTKLISLSLRVFAELLLGCTFDCRVVFSELSWASSTFGSSLVVLRVMSQPSAEVTGRLRSSRCGCRRAFRLVTLPSLSGL